MVRLQVGERHANETKFHWEKFPVPLAGRKCEGGYPMHKLPANPNVPLTRHLPAPGTSRATMQPLEAG